MALQGQISGGEGQGLAGGDAHLPFHQVQRVSVPADDLLGHGVLDLQAGVHLHEEELLRVLIRDQELHRPRSQILHRPRGVHGGLPHALAQLRTVRKVLEQRRGGLFDHLLVAALQGALAFGQVHRVPLGVGQDLDLDVPWPPDQTFQEQGVVAEGAAGGASGAGQGLRELLGALDGEHALAAASGRGLDQQREPHVLGGVQQLLIAQSRLGDAGDHRDAVGGDVLFGADLVPHGVQRVHAGADEGDPGLVQGAREVHVLREEAVAGMDGLGPGTAAGLDDRVDVQVALGGRGRPHPLGVIGLTDVECLDVRIRVDGHRADPQAAQGADDAHGDLAAIGHQDGVEEGLDVGAHRAHITHGVGRAVGGLGHRSCTGHMRNRPKEVSGSGARDTTSRAMPSTRRVSAGSMMPSSQRRAVE